MTIRRNRGPEIEVVAKDEAECQFVMIRTRIEAKRIAWLAIDRPAVARLGAQYSNGYGGTFILAFV